MEFVDTHCHIHFDDYELDQEEVITAAKVSGVTKLLCVGCTLKDSLGAVEVASRHKNIWASIGLHPHEGSEYVHDHKALQRFRQLAAKPQVVAIGETGLDYYYNHSPKADQQKLLRFQLDVAKEYNLPLIFHVRDALHQDKSGTGRAFDDFWPIIDEYKGLRGVVHSFSASPKELDEILSRGLYVGLNGIMTFTKDPKQLEAAKKVPIDRLLLETDAPFLTPVPFRGTICQPKHVVETAKFLATLRGESLELLAAQTTHNATTLFHL